MIAIVTLIEDTSNALQNINSSFSISDLNTFLSDKLALYKQPKKLYIRAAIPRNHMGKVNKKSIMSELDINIIDK